MNTILTSLHDKTKFYLNKLREHLKYKDDYIDDKLQLLAEYMAFDYIHQKFNVDQEQIEKAKQIFNLEIA